MADYITELKNFSKLDFQSKQDIINKGRPTPELNILQTTGQKNRLFQMEWYSRKDWLCGCQVTNRLFCFPCILFSKNCNVWTDTGYCDLKNLQRSFIKHEHSTIHIQSQISLKTFGVSRIDLALDEQRKLDKSIHNAKVRENREILKDFINATCFLAKQQLAFGGNDESVDSANRGNYVELLHAFAEKDERLARHLETSPGLSNRIQNDLIEAISDVIRDDIKKEINSTQFVSVEVNGTTDIANYSQVSVVLRYVAKSESGFELKKAFLGFDDVNGDRRASAISEYILTILKKYECTDKLVAQTYDGTAVMASELNGVQAKIKEVVPEAMFIHCYAHKLNLILMNSAKCIPECRAFFKTAEGLASFFNKSIKRTKMLDNVVKQRLPRAAPIRWNSNSSLIQTISMYQEDISILFQEITENPDHWDNNTLMMAVGYDRWLAKESTCFLLVLYEDIFNETDALCKVLQNKVMDIEFCRNCINDSISSLNLMRCNFDNIYEKFEKKCGAIEVEKNTFKEKQTSIFNQNRIFCLVLDNVIKQMKARFDHFGELAFLGLLNCVKFNEMSKNFDESQFQSLSKYAKFFDFVKLKADLIGLYSSQIIKDECNSPMQLLSFLAQKDLIQVVSEATKLLQLVLTITATTASVERSFSVLKRLKTYSKNRTNQGRLSSLALIWMEKERLSALKKDKDNFYSKIIDSFISKEHRMDFIYK